MKKMVTIILFIFLAILVLFSYLFFIFKAPVQKKIIWGVNFSQMQAESLKLNWKKTYLAILEDLGAKHIKLLPQWDWVEGKRGNFYFNDIDWQVAEAEKHDAKLIYVLGMKSGRWPECHIPSWANGLSKQEMQEELLKYITEVVIRYKGRDTIVAWQAENEPLFHFGECPWYDEAFLKKEVETIQSLDPARPVIVSDSGEQSLWLKVAGVGDIVGVTMYRTVWVHLTDGIGFYLNFPIPPVVYWYKSQLIQYIFHKKVICVELQSEPWAFKVFTDVPLAEQEKTMNLTQFKDNVAYAQGTGLPEFYFWGTEWWYWLKETQNKPEIWQEARNLFHD